VRFPPRGRQGGGDGGAGTQWIERDGRRLPLAARVVGAPVRAGDVFVMSTSGGGGLGDPRTRDPDAVAADVAARTVSVEAAGEVYGVVLTAAGEVDVDATNAMRGER
jgi:N-methylhydantoinase B